MRCLFIPLTVAALFLALALAPAARAEDLLTNGDFARWEGSVPAGWTADEGARSNAGPDATQVSRIPEGGLRLEGHAATGRWTLLRQTVSTKPGEYLELTFEGRGLELRREAKQFGSCYVGLLWRDAAGQVQGFRVEDVRQDAWRAGRVYLRVPATAARVDATVFLSLTGRLEVRRLGVRRLGPEDAYDVLVAEMDRHYSFFAPHAIDWNALTSAAAPAARAATSPAAFIAAIDPLLAKLQDGHVWIDAPDGTRTVPHAPTVALNFEIQPLLAQLEGVQQVMRDVLAARTRAGYGYFALGTMQGTDAQYAAVERALRGLFDAPGLIVDLRVNKGGQEAWGQRLCALLASERVLYARALGRGGPAHDDLVPLGERHVEPAPSGRYAGPVVVLIGPGCVSSGEGMALMLAALPDVTLIGQPTRGSSGNPQPIELPNGVSVWFSRWISLLPDGSPLERHGVPPDERVTHRLGADATLAAAIRLLDAQRSADKKR
ncbi:MAG: S41 family peptidase [Planctomycetota bacterium]|nr:S41 family peptidase [Planctomycetota bacterium]